jgi:Holliday junction DNA helicase RuvA
MIGTVRGRLAGKAPPHIVLECAGVGYEIETPMSTFLDLPDVGADVFLHTHLQVREDSQTLFGFATAEEKALFRSLLKVSGVGAKIGLAILSAMSVADFERCVQYGDTATLVKIPGVGRKTAERLMVELRDRLGKAPPHARVAGRTVRADAKSEAIDALIALGYRQNEVQRLLATFNLEGKSAEDIIRQALRQAVS